MYSSLLEQPNVRVCSCSFVSVRQNYWECMWEVTFTCWNQDTCVRNRNEFTLITYMEVAVCVCMWLITGVHVHVLQNLHFIMCLCNWISHSMLIQHQKQQAAATVQFCDEGCNFLRARGTSEELFHYCTVKGGNLTQVQITQQLQKEKRGLI